MTLIDGKLVAAAVKDEVREKIKKAEELYGKKFVLSVVIVGNDPASEIYVRNKGKACESVGIFSDTVALPENASQEEVEEIVKQKANDPSVDGILVQLPLPKGLDEKRILKLIPPEKDVDGFSDANVGKLATFSKEAINACTPQGMIKLLDYYGIPLAGKNAVVIGRSNVVGKPMALMLLQRDCTVSVCHSKTENLAEYTRKADIVVCAAGKKGILTADMVKDGVVVLDAGINRVDGKIYGDADFEGVSKKASYITPVPGGVGPMTIAMLVYNAYIAGMRKIGR